VAFDAFLDKRSGIVTQTSLPAVYGAIPPYLNLGEVTTKGIEGMLTYSNKIGDFAYSLSAMALLTNNTIDYMAEIQMYENARRTGNAIGTQFGYEADGFYEIDDFNSDGSIKEGLPVPSFGLVQQGDIRYKDIKADGIIDESDLVKIGNPYFPSTTYAFNLSMQYKGFDVNVLLQGVAGSEVNLLYIPSQSVPFADNRNAYPMITDRWAYYPEQGIDTRATAKYPRLSAETNINNTRNSDFWLKNGDFFKLRNLEIGYSLPKSVTQKIALSNVRLFLTAHNLMSFSWLEKNYGIDPENMAGYPSMKSITMGININL
jgi:hypothetical protein